MAGVAVARKLLILTNCFECPHSRVWAATELGGCPKHCECLKKRVKSEPKVIFAATDYKQWNKWNGKIPVWCPLHDYNSKEKVLARGEVGENGFNKYGCKFVKIYVDKLYNFKKNQKVKVVCDE